jgi:uncharacterized membrane protein
MGPLLDNHIVQGIFWCVVLAVLVSAAWWLLRSLRGSPDDEPPVSSALLTKFRELHLRGGLSDEEYRTIKTLLTERLRNELKDAGEKV